nr:ribonuclease H-like domain-containing protein [Tanacetum cinerariifolium]
MMIEQYFLMTNYSLWEVILNGDSPVPTRIVEGVAQPVAPTTVEQKLARKNELKARDSLSKGPPQVVSEPFGELLLKKNTFLHVQTHTLFMDSLSPQVVSATKLPILNPNEFDLWKMRIEQYFLMTNYSLWEVILNGDSPVPTRIVE